MRGRCVLPRCRLHLSGLQLRAWKPARVAGSLHAATDAAVKGRGAKASECSQRHPTRHAQAYPSRSAATASSPTGAAATCGHRARARAPQRGPSMARSSARRASLEAALAASSGGAVVPPGAKALADRRCGITRDRRRRSRGVTGAEPSHAGWAASAGSAATGHLPHEPSIPQRPPRDRRVVSCIARLQRVSAPDEPRPRGGSARQSILAPLRLPRVGLPDGSPGGRPAEVGLVEVATSR